MAKRDKKEAKEEKKIKGSRKNLVEYFKDQGIHLRQFNAIMIAVSCVLALILMFCVIRATSSYRAMRVATDEYISCQRYAEDLREASDYLTEEAQAFAVTGEVGHVHKYFNEVQNVRRRDKAVDALKAYIKKTEASDYLNVALWYSDELTKWEYYSMRMTVAARGYDLSQFPEEVQNAEVTREDLKLSSEEQEERAQQVLFDAFYQEYKDRINRSVSLCTENLVVSTRHEQSSSSDHLLRLLNLQKVLIVILLLAVFGVVIMTNYLVIRPMRESVAMIQKQRLLPLNGAYELKYLSEAYNRMLIRTQLTHNRLINEAEHDPLTGLFSKDVYDRIRDNYPQDRLAVLLVDVDEFHHITGTFGKEVGDQVLKRVAQLLSESVRSEDYVCRLENDKFAVIMVHMTSAMKNMVREKIQTVNETLQNTEGMPTRVTLSVGVAFGDRKKPTGDIFEDADTALFRVKRNGKNGCEFY